MVRLQVRGMLMALLPPEFMDTTVAIGVPVEDNEYEWLGTGFLYCYPTDKFSGNKGDQKDFIFLITNRHVAEANEDLHVRFNGGAETNSNVHPLPTSGSDVTMPWTYHSNADVAALMIHANNLEDMGVSISSIHRDRNAFTREHATTAGLSEGDGVFVMGFPLGIAGQDRNHVIVRQGVLSLIQPWLRGDESEFLIDSSVYPGNSGGPVLIKPEAVAIRGTQANAQCALIGMVSSYLPYRDVAISSQTKRPRVIFEENSGLAVVVPVDQIHETLEQALVDTRQFVADQVAAESV